MNCLLYLKRANWVKMILMLQSSSYENEFNKYPVEKIDIINAICKKIKRYK